MNKLRNIIRNNSTLSLAVLLIGLFVFTVQPALGASSVNLDQCANGGIGHPPKPCNNLAPNSSWQNGNLNGNQAHYAEGQFVPYRLTLTGLTLGAHNVTIQYAVTKGNQHALDYLGSFDFTETVAMGNNPCGDIIIGCNPAVPNDTEPVPPAALNGFPPATGLNTFTGTQTPGSFAIWSGNFTSPIVYVAQNVIISGDYKTTIKLNFTATNSTVVIAWGGHIASANDWGFGNSSSFISGSPYHMIFDSIDGDFGKSQDKSLATSAVLPTVTVFKHVINDNGGTAVASDFTMNVSSSISPSFPGNESGTTVSVNEGSYSVTETGPSGYNASFSSGCTGSLTAGHTATCNVTNNDIGPKLTVIKHVINDDGGTAVASNFTMNVAGTNVSPSSFPGNESGINVTLNAGSYSVTETGPSGYSNSSSANCSGTIALNQTKTCTITNDDIGAKLIVVKHVINDNGGTNTAADFTMNVTGNNPSPSSFAGSESGTTVNISTGAYSVSETGPTNYTNTSSPDCSGTIAVGQTKTCTITNNDIGAKLIVVKHVINDNGGTNVSSDFTMIVTGNNPSPSSFTGNESGTTVNLNAGAYSVSETGPSGYSNSSTADCSGIILAGQTKTCTITNDDIAPQLTVIKHVINNDGGTNVSSDFTMNVAGTNVSTPSFPGNESGTTVTLDAGTYSVSETGPSGYSNSSSADCSGTIAVGENKTCTITNDDLGAKLIVIKHVINDNGGTNVSSDFTMNVKDTNVTPTSFPGNESGTTVTLNAGTYSVNETGPSGYSNSSSGDCSGTIAVGETKTCTITNDDIAPQLTVIKHIINNDGGTNVSSDFTMNVAGTNVSPSSFPGNESGTTVTLNEGSYSVTETGPSGYSNSSSTDCSGTITVGQTKTCTITNDDIGPKLIVIKHVVNDDGGTNTATDFTMTVTGNNPSPASFAGNESGTTVNLSAGTYSVSEAGPTNYTNTSSSDCSGTISVGQTKTCTITNDDISAKLIVIKHVVNDDGGTNASSDFIMNVAGTNVSPSSFPGNESGTTVTLNAGTYSVSETGPSGYSNSSSTDCSGAILAGQTKTCTITNDDIGAKLIVIKHVINDNGGTDTAADFTMTVTGNNPSPASFAGNESGTTVNLSAGAYSVSEAGPTNYTNTSSSDCSGTISIGQTKTCTITNDDIAPQLTVVKHVINDNGGTNVSSDFTMKVTGTNVSPSLFPGNESGTTVTLNAGAYSVNETGPSGYSNSSSADCSGTISAGQTKTCTITNDDIGPKLIVVKHVINDNGGTNVSSDFTMSVAGTNVSPSSFPGNESGTIVMLNEGSYSVSETGPSGYSNSSSADCSGTIAVGETKKCTITNDDLGAKLIVIKHVINDNGGTNTAADFTMNVADTNVSPSSFPGNESGTTVTLNAGAYSVSETGPTNYTNTSSSDCSGTISVGQTKTCTITNDDISAKLIVIKHVVNDDGGTNVSSDFTMNVAGTNVSPSLFPGNESGTTATLNAGTYSVSETGPSGYSNSSSADCSGTILAGQTKICTITNDDIGAKLTVIKHVINDDGGTNTAKDFTMTVTGNNPSPSSFAGNESGTTVNISAGAYSVSETGPSGYSNSSSADCSGTIAIGQSKTCTITNDDIGAKLIVVKHVINDDGGTNVSSDFIMNVAGTNVSPSSFPGNESGTAVTLNAGTYSVTETGLSGYSNSSSVDCSGTIAVGETKTCTITNNDLGARLIVIKHVINNDGGTNTAADFTMNVADTNVSPSSFPGNESGTTVTLNAGTYSVSETGPSGYSNSSSADCSGTIAVGQTKTCTITNDDIGAKLIVVKHAINDDGGTNTAKDFTMIVTGNSPSPSSFAGNESGTTVSLSAGAYSVSETGPSGYSNSSSADCSGTIAIGQIKTCTITNDDIGAKLIVIKHVINNDGGTAVASNFTMKVTGTNVSPSSFPGNESGTTVTLNQGSYSVTETGPSGYSNSSSADCSGTITVGQTKTCTITNDDILAGKPGKVVGWGLLGPRDKPEKKFNIWVYNEMLSDSIVEVQDTKNRLTIKNTRIDSVMTVTTTKPMTGTIKGLAKVTGGPSPGVYSFQVDVVDAANPGAGADTFKITLSGYPGGYTNSGTLSMGDITVIK